MEKLSFRVADYDAPLDLILHLLSRRKLDIADIDISSLLEQYLLAISAWQTADLEIASEFLEMASRLVYIKTVSLLPKHEEESEKLRQELTGQLIEYRLCKLAAVQLRALSSFGSVYARAPMKWDADETYALTHPASLLSDALAGALGSGASRLPPSREIFEPLVMRPPVSVSSKIFAILRLLRSGGCARKDSLFAAAHNRSGIVATFLAMLELIKSGKVCVDGDSLRIK